MVVARVVVVVVVVQFVATLDLQPLIDDGQRYKSECVAAHQYTCVRVCVRACVHVCVCIWCRAWCSVRSRKREREGSGGGESPMRK